MRMTQQLTHPDLSDKVPIWFEQAIDLAQRVGSAALADGLLTLKRYLDMPTTKVVFVGPSGSGKSTLLNHLLGRPIIPTGPTPTTGAITTILSGTSEHMEICYGQNPHDVRSIPSISWSGLTVGDDLDRLDLFPSARVYLPNAWLAWIQAELVDTPGVDSTDSEGALLVSNQLDQCDMAVFVVSAPFALSLTDRDVFSQLVLSRHFPSLVAVATKLDQISLLERATVLDHVRARFHTVSPHTSVIPGHAADPQTAAAIIAELQASIAHTALRGDMRALRQRRAALSIRDITLQIRKQAHFLASEASNHTVADSSSSARERDIEQMGDQWNRVATEMHDRRRRLQDWLNAQLLDIADGLLENFMAERDDSAIYRTTLPRLVNRPIEEAVRGAWIELERAFVRDSTWLREEVERIFGEKLIFGWDLHHYHRFLLEHQPPVELPAADELSAPYQLRQIAIGAAAVFAFDFLFSHVPAIASLRKPIDKALELSDDAERLKQRLRLNEQFRHAVEATIDQCTSRFVEVVNDLYGSCFRELSRARERWGEMNGQQRGRASGTVTEVFLQIAERADALCADIETAVGSTEHIG